ncbi:MAG TPA: YcxB family protein [Clostridia bacterium]
MQEVLNINVKITPKDLIAFSFTKARSGIRFIGFILYIIVAVLLITGIVTAVLGFDDAELKAFTVRMFSVLLILIQVLYLVPALSMYLRLRNSFRKSRLLQAVQHYRIFDDRIESWSENERVALPWKDVYFIYELKPCFAIYPAPGMVFLIPRRCFASQEQLDLFISVLESEADRKKIRLKKYKLKNSSPDFDETGMKIRDMNENRGTEHQDADEMKGTNGVNEANEAKGPNEIMGGNIDAAQTAGSGIGHATQDREEANVQENPVLETEFMLLRKEYINLSYRLFYTKPGGLIMTAVGILFAALSARGFILDSGKPWVLLAPALIFTLYPPLAIYFGGRKHYDRNAALQKPKTMKFYNDHFVIVHPSGTSSINFSDLVKITEEKTAILLYVTDRLVHIIPKRVFEGRADDLLALRKLLGATGLMK